MTGTNKVGGQLGNIKKGEKKISGVRNWQEAARNGNVWRIWKLNIKKKK